MKWPLLCFAYLSSLIPASVSGATPIASFSKAELSGWQEKSFVGHTQYYLTTDSQKMVLEARSDASASIYYKEIDVDLNKTPILNWSWKLIQPIIDNNKEKSMKGDDFSARVYVVYQYGFFPWSTIALNYVWSSTQAIGSSWDSPYSAKDRMIALQSGSQKQRQWQHEKRNIKADFFEHFEENVNKITGIAIMADTDSTLGIAASRYGDIFFSED